MGTLDEKIITDCLQVKVLSGEIDVITILEIGVKGGASYCVVVRDELVRINIIVELL